MYSLYTYLPLRVSQGFGGTSEHWQNIKGNKGTREHELIFREQGNITVQIRRRKHFDIRNKYMLFTGWEVRSAINRNDEEKPAIRWSFEMGVGGRSEKMLFDLIFGVR